MGFQQGPTIGKLLVQLSESRLITRRHSGLSHIYIIYTYIFIYTFLSQKTPCTQIEMKKLYRQFSQFAVGHRQTRTVSCFLPRGVLLEITQSTATQLMRDKCSFAQTEPQFLSRSSPTSGYAGLRSGQRNACNSDAAAHANQYCLLHFTG